MDNLTQLNELTDMVIKCFFKVYNTLGYRFLDKIYERALYIELQLINYLKATDVEFELF